MDKQKRFYISTNLTIIYRLTFALFLVTTVYCGALTVPLYVDDSVILNQADNLIPPDTFLHLLNFRYIGLSSYSLSQLFGERIIALHAITLFIHFLNACLIWFFINALGQVLASSEGFSIKEQQLNGMSYAVALLWLIHPLNTQAVVYISQRFTVLAMFFTMLSLIFYTLSIRKQNKTSYSIPKNVSFILLSICFFILAFGSKQTVIFLPVFIFLMTFKLITKQRIKLLIIATLSVTSVVVAFYVAPEFIIELDKITRETNSYSRLDYFATQLKVILQYFKLLFFPFPLKLESQVSLISFGSTTFYHYLAIHVAFIITISFISVRYKQPLMLIALAMLYLGLAVESSFIPIQDLYFEHRMYLPSAAGLLILTNLCRLVLNSFAKTKILKLVLLGLFVLCFSVLSYIRVQEWQTPLKFYQLELDKSPNSTRAMSSYGRELAKNGSKKEALKLILQAYNLELEQGVIRQSNLVALLTILVDSGYYQDALNLGRRALKHTKSRPKLQSLVYSQLAFVYYKMNICEFAIGWSNKALILDNNNQLAPQVILLCSK
ncbi:tetratricopeptide repeat protein [Litorilituus lipolyticus]|uniref:Uncharacterized protein n=1 Tax=Litorilituus lipolyticus TaxID=2491017 RepID=A0A502L993_9GAMM|nr:hypothetical protein [Litorilituus lipolyticus]TPH18965.1 hypothetical protein EPA86_01325 [Litorilituus lipolyticus]